MTNFINAKFIVSAEKLSQCPNFDLDEYPLLGGQMSANPHLSMLLQITKSLPKLQIPPEKQD